MPHRKESQLRAETVAMVLRYFFNVLYLNSWESRGGVTEEGEGGEWDGPWVGNPTAGL